MYFHCPISFHVYRESSPTVLLCVSLCLFRFLPLSSYFPVSFLLGPHLPILPSFPCPLHSANCYNSIVPSLPVGSNGINKAEFEIDFLSAPFWITLPRGFGSEHSSSTSCCLWYHNISSQYPFCWRTTSLTVEDYSTRVDMMLYWPLWRPVKHCVLTYPPWEKLVRFPIEQWL